MSEKQSKLDGGVEGFHELLIDILAMRLARGNYASIVGERTFTFYTGAGAALGTSDLHPDRNLIQISQNSITVIDPKVEGKQITYHLKSRQGVTREVCEDILKYFVN